MQCLITLYLRLVRKKMETKTIRLEHDRMLRKMQHIYLTPMYQSINGRIYKYKKKKRKKIYYYIIIVLK